MKIYQPAYQSTQTDNTGAVVDSYSFDAWGNRVGNIWNTPDNVTHLFDRGYTGHEHLDQFGLINMNGRIYDPKLGRFLSPDPYIQEPENTQSFNRYSYCLNNPLVFTDPSGNSFSPFIMARALFIFGSILDRVLNPWDHEAESFGESLKFGFNKGNYAYNRCMDNFSISLGLIETKDFNLKLTLSPNITSGVGYFLASLSASYKLGDFTFNASSSASNAGFDAGGGIGYYDRNNKQSFGFDAHWFMGGKDDQFMWQASWSNDNGWSARVNEDWKVSDKYRTFAAEIGTPNFSFGSAIYTNEADGKKDLNSEKGTWVSRLWGPNKDKGTYVTGKREYSYFYVGIKNGNRVSRIGIDSPWVQDAFQNGFHRIGYNTPFFRTDYDTPSKFYYFEGFNNPYSIYH